MDTPNITADLIRDIFKSFKEKAPGASGLTRTMFLPAAYNIHRIYGEIFTSCLAAGYFPEPFKTAKMVMIPKHGKDLSRVENYRPISLLEVPGKALEKIIEMELKQHLDDDENLDRRQHGFRREKRHGHRHRLGP